MHNINMITETEIEFAFTEHGAQCEYLAQDLTYKTQIEALTKRAEEASRVNRMLRSASAALAHSSQPSGPHGARVFPLRDVAGPV